MNPVTGEKILEIGGRELVMRFDWRALSEVEKKFGDKPNLFDPETVAAVAEAGLRPRHPDMTAKRIIELSPPLVPFANAVQTALQWAYFGAEAVPKLEEGSKKKSLRRGDGLWKRIARRLRQVFLRSSSGA